MDKYLFPAVTSGIIAELTTLPISIIKTNYQTNGKYTINKNNYIKSILPTILQKGLSSALRYSLFYNFLEKDKSSLIKNGIYTGLITSAIISPIHTFTINKHLGKKINFYSYNSFKGIEMYFLRSVLLTSLQLPVYEYLKEYNKTFISSKILTTIVTTTIVHPIDLIMTKKMSGQSSKIKNLYKGYFINLSRVIPHFYISMYLFESLKVKV